jgi:hypothetical protein
MKGSEEGALVSIKIWTLAGGDCGDASKTTGSSVFHSVTFRFRRNDVPAMQLWRGMSCPFVMFALPASKHFESFSWSRPARGPRLKSEWTLGLPSWVTPDLTLYY